MNETNDDYIIPFGKHQGKRIGDCPADYLLWFIEQDWASKWKEMYQYVIKNEKQLMDETERN